MYITFVQSSGFRTFPNVLNYFLGEKELINLYKFSKVLLTLHKLILIVPTTTVGEILIILDQDYLPPCTTTV